MAKPKSVYLTDRTMSAMRGDEGLSGRINQIADRYLEIAESNKEWVVRVTTAEDRQIIREAFAVGCCVPGTSLAVLRATLTEDLRDEPVLANLVSGMTTGDFLALVELLEAMPTPATHS